MSRVNRKGQQMKLERKRRGGKKGFQNNHLLILINRKPLRNQTNGRQEIKRQKNKNVSVQLIFSPFCIIVLAYHLAVTLVCLVYYLVGVSMSECRVVLAGAVGGPVFVHGGGGRGFVQ